MPEVVSVAFSIDHRPLISIDHPEGTQGILVDFWRLWGERAGVEVEFQFYQTWHAALDAVIAGQADFNGASCLEAELDGDLLFSRPFAKLKIQAVQRLSAPPIRQLADLAGLRIGLESFAEAEKQFIRLQGAEILSLGRTVDLTLAERTGDIDAFILPTRKATSLLSAADLEDFRLTELYERRFFAAVSTSRPELIDLFNRGLAGLALPELRTMEIKWLDSALDPFFLDPRDRFDYTLEQLRWLQEHPRITLGASEWVPLTALDDRGEYSGLGLELLHFLLGRVGVTAEIVGDKDWLTVVDWSLEGTIDGLGYTVPSPDKLEKLTFSEPYVKAPFVVVSKINAPFLGGLSDLADQRLAIHSEYGIRGQIESKYPEIELVAVESHAHAMRAVASGKADAALEVLPVARRVIRDLGMTELKIALRTTTLTDDLALGVRKEWTPLIELFNRSLASVPEQEIDSLYARWDLESHRSETDRRQVVRLALLMTSPIILVLIWTFWRGLQRQREAQVAIRQSERRLRRAQRLGRMGSGELDPHLGDLVLSPETHRLYDRSKPFGELDLEGFLALYQDSAAADLRSAIHQAVEHRDSAELELPVRSPAEEPPRFHQILLRWAEFEAGRGKVVFNLQDVTQHHQADEARRQLELEVQQLRKMEALGNLAGGIAHDFNNLLQAILGYTDLAANHLEDGHPSKALLEKSVDGALRARQLVSQILAFSRKDIGERREIDLAKVIQDTLPLLRASLPTTIEISSEISGGQAMISGNRSQIEQVLMNLCVNAGQSMADGGCLSITLASANMAAASQMVDPGWYWRLRVQDTGTGMPPEVLERIFEPFFTTKPLGKGTGMGLSIVHSVVTAHHGWIDVDSTEGRGTVFNVYLPRIDANPEETAQSAVLRFQGEGQRIMVVDDELAVAEVNELLLRRLGYQPVVFTDSVEARDELLRNPDDYDLLLTDMTMPGITGTDLARELAALRPTIPIVLSTGFSTENIQSDVDSGLIRRILDKPVTAATLAAAIAEALE